MENLQRSRISKHKTIKRRKIYEERQGEKDKEIHVAFMMKLKIKIHEETHE